ncbi:MAG: PQQ-binding-like beta-propeller repeat protein, partial [Anaerolineae bacterium]|nr:PQQ-binding-like beta-propeller repeat protein [Anaerolineae bacterium]
KPTATHLATPFASPTPSATYPPATPMPSPTPRLVTSPVISLTAPLVIDSESRRLYMTGVLDGVEQIVALSATDGQLLAAYGITGTFDVDPIHGWLYVDQAEVGLVVLNIQTGDLHTTIPLPADKDRWRRGEWAPQADPITGQALAFRENVVYIIDPTHGKIVDTVVFDIPARFSGQESGQGLLQWTEYDSNRRLLYLDFKTDLNPSFMVPDNETIISYDLDNNIEVARIVVGTAIRATAFDGRLYGADWYNIWSHWIWQDGKPHQESSNWWHRGDWEDQTGFYVDPMRERLYESSGGFRVFDANTLTLVMSLPNPVDGRLAGYDPKTDQLYFLAKGQLYIWPTEAIRPPSFEPLKASHPPTMSVQHLFVSPAWSYDRSLFGLWGYDISDCDYAGSGSLLLVSKNGGDTWGQPRGGLRGTCERISALAISPNYARDQTVFVGIVGMGIFKSTDGGKLWQPSNTGLSNMNIHKIFLSPGYEHDQTVFADAWGSGGIFRSVDSGITWQPLDIELNQIVMSPEFDRDKTLIGSIGGKILVSRDGGITWKYTGDILPGKAQSGVLSIAPMFSNHQIIFAHSQNALYRSVDGGHSWETVLSLNNLYQQQQLIYGPQTEKGGTIFLLLTDLHWEDGAVFRTSTFYHSEDGVNWQEVELPPDIVPTAIAISPAYAEDGLLFLGTEDGRVVALDAAALVAGEQGRSEPLSTAQTPRNSTRRTPPLARPAVEPIWPALGPPARAAATHRGAANTRRRFRAAGRPAPPGRSCRAGRRR